ncbi:MAG: DEAD/DEAH box helicase [Roseivirga sp.]|nr:DEAD/DEAH box helicase [Roseivirga sp.]
MTRFEDLNLSKQLNNALADLSFDTPTPIQSEAFPVVLSGKDLVGIAQTGTGKTFAYLLPLLRDLKFSKQVNPRILILVPTRELVLQVVEQAQLLTEYMSVRILGVYGGTNINTQGQEVAQGVDILVATPGRLYDLALNRLLQLKSINKLVIDEVDVMLDQGFRFQLQNIFELLPERRQNIMFSATMTEEVDELITDYFTNAAKISIALSGTRLDSITQLAYPAQNFHTKANLLSFLLSDKQVYKKVLVFVASKKIADRLHETLLPRHGSELAIIHSNKSQNFRIRAIEDFDDGRHRILLATDVIGRGLDFDQVSHVINFDVPSYPENYMHRIGRTGRAEQQGTSILFFSPKESEEKEAIEALMDYKIPLKDFPSQVEISNTLIPEERPKDKEINSAHKVSKTYTPGPAFHEKKEKNQKENQGGSYRREMAKKYKKPRTKGGKRRK